MSSIKGISKLDAARRQLLAAIHLHWFLNEPLAVYSLASNAWELSSTLLKNENRVRIMKEMARANGSRPEDIAKLINRPQNFVKHADRDPSAELDLTQAECDTMIMIAAIDYIMAARRSPPLSVLYLAWFSAIYPSKTGSFHRDMANQYFPGLADLDREKQIMSARQNAATALRPAAIEDFRLELTDNGRWTPLRQLGAKLPVRV